MPTVLVIQHEDDCPAALLGRWLLEEGVRLDVRRPYAGDPLPADLVDHAGLLVLGGPMDADSEATHAWLGPTKALLRAAVSTEVPTLGICLGHQMLAAALGGAVTRNPAGRQLGLLPLGWTDAAAHDALLGPLTGDRRCLHWNQDVVVALPEDAVALALAPGGEIQAARFGPRAWGLQPHPEADQVVVRAWAESDDERLAPGADVAARVAPLVVEVAAARAELERAWRPLATSFARLLLEVRVG